MTGVLASQPFIDGFGDELARAAAAENRSIEFITPPAAAGARLSAAQCARVECAYLDRDLRFVEQLHTAFWDAARAAVDLRWIHFVSSALNPHPYLSGLTARGVRFTTSTGSNAEPVAQTGFTGLLSLARRFPAYLEAQRKREWRPLRGAALPPDLAGQTVVLVGVGAVGTVFAGYCKAFGMKVIGVRRSPRGGEPVDEMHPPARLGELLPRADWLVLCCPLTAETRALIDARMLAQLPRGARLVNISRGEVIDQPALIAALTDGRLAGAHLDVFAQEPLAADSPLWALPNVIVTPHNASASTGNAGRAARIFIANFARWARGEPLANEARAD